MRPRWPRALRLAVLDAVPGLAPRTYGRLRLPVGSWQDMAGLTTGRLPRFVKLYGDMRADLLTAARRFVTEVAVGSYPDQAHSYL
jgi:hypothetical protein